MTSNLDRDYNIMRKEKGWVLIYKIKDNLPKFA